MCRVRSDLTYNYVTPHRPKLTLHVTLLNLTLTLVLSKTLEPEQNGRHKRTLKKKERERGGGRKVEEGWGEHIALPISGRNKGKEKKKSVLARLDFIPLEPCGVVHACPQTSKEGHLRPQRTYPCGLHSARSETKAHGSTHAPL